MSINSRPKCEACNKEAIINESIKPQFSSGFGQKPRKVTIGYCCLSCCRRFVAQWDEDKMPEEERKFCRSKGLNV